MSAYAVVGSPVGHSLSPAMMRAAFGALGVSATYEARDIPPERWNAAPAELHREGFSGVNVTVPHKEGALAAARDASPAARAIGAANVLVRRDDGWDADNTDGPGFLDWARELGVEDLLAREALVLGAGGSARAVVWALLRAGCPRVRVANRSRVRADALARAAPGRIRIEPPGRTAPAGGMVVQCTSLGLRPDDPLPAPVDLLAPAAVLLDLVYPEPPLVRAARAAGLAAHDGLGLLVAQGVLSVQRWLGVRPDAVVMRAAAEAELAKRR